MTKLIVGVLGVVLIGLNACSSRSTVAPDKTASLHEDLTALPLNFVWPLPANIEEELTREATTAMQGSCSASWRRFLQLLDLFDALRFFDRQTPESKHGLAVLWRAMNLPGAPSRGPLATRHAQTGLGKELELVKKQCPKLQDCQNAQALLSADQQSRSTIDAARRTSLLYQQLAQRDSAIAANAQLRLYHWCFQAFQFAASASPAQRQKQINQCLFPLFPADPSQYFRIAASDRPPDPPWPVLALRLSELRQKLSQSRLAPLGNSLAAAEAEFFRAMAPRLPSPISLNQNSWPSIKQAQAWDRTPLVVAKAQGFLVDNIPVLADDDDALLQALKRQLTQDRRQRVSYISEANFLVEKLLLLARAARQVGVNTLELAGLQIVADQAPKGDVQHLLWVENPVKRLEVYPLPLPPQVSSRLTGDAISRSEPKLQHKKNEAADGDEIVLRLGSKKIMFLAAEGKVTVAADRHTNLEQIWTAIGETYDLKSTVIIELESDLTYQQLLTALYTLQRPPINIRFSQLMLRTTVASENNDLPSLEPFLEQTKKLQATPAATIPSAWLEGLSRCYRRFSLRSLLEKSPLRQGTLIIREKNDHLIVDGGTLRDKALAVCVETFLATQPKPDLTSSSKLLFHFSLNN